MPSNQNNIKTGHDIVRRARTPRSPSGLAALALSALLASACSGDDVSLGEGIGVDRAALESYVAVWEGYMEAHTLASGSDRVVIHIDGDGRGEIVFGEGSPPPVPTDPADPFPGQNVGNPSDAFGDLLIGAGAVHEGFAYAIEARVEAARIRASGNANQVMQAACALQTPVSIGNDSYACLPNTGSRWENGQCFVPSGPDDTALTEPVSCGQLALCTLGRGCECDASECRAAQGEGILFDAALEDTGDRMTGTLRSPGVNAVQVHLIRQ